MNGLITTIWNSFLAFFMQILQWIVAGFAGVVSLLLSMVMSLLTFLFGLLPNVPAAPTFVVGFTSLGNYILPLGEALGLLTVMGTVYAGIFIYKFVKLARGGG